MADGGSNKKLRRTALNVFAAAGSENSPRDESVNVRASTDGRASASSVFGRASPARVPDDDQPSPKDDTDSGMPTTTGIFLSKEDLFKDGEDTPKPSRPSAAAASSTAKTTQATTPLGAVTSISLKQNSNDNAESDDDNDVDKELSPSAYQLICQQLMHDGYFDLCEQLRQRAHLTSMLPQSQTTYLKDLACLMIEADANEKQSQMGALKAKKDDNDNDPKTNSWLKSFRRTMHQGTADKIEKMPEATQLDDEERFVTAAICIVRANQLRPPTYCPPARVKLFVFLHSRWYTRVLLFLMLCHVFMAQFEVSPRFYHEDWDTLVSRGYYVAQMKIVDIVCVGAYCVHCFLLSRLEGGFKGVLQNGRLMCMYILTFFLFIDMIKNLASAASARPFRPLRPCMFILNSSSMTRMLIACMNTFTPLLKVFMLCMAVTFFYSLVTLNLFGGYEAVPPNSTDIQSTFGGVCLYDAGFGHPLASFGDALLNMYVLTTVDNFPAIVRPFWSCGCTFDVNNQTCSSEANPYNAAWDGNGKACGSRRGASYLVFGTFITIMGFCLGNVVLAVCYCHFETVAKRLLLHAAILKRESLLEAFYYLQQGGYVTKESFLRCTSYVRRMNLGQTAGKEDISHFYFESLDADDDGVLEISEFFHVVEMMKTQVVVSHQHDFERTSPLYYRWKVSNARKTLMRLLKMKWHNHLITDLVIDGLVVLNAFLASMESTRRSALGSFADFLTFVFVVEVIVKCLGLGVKRFWSNYWNRFDVRITVLSLLAFVGNELTKRGTIDDNYSTLMDLVSLLRILRLIKMLKRFTAETGFFSRILNAIFAAVPACAELLLLIIFEMYFFAVLGMELLGKYDTNSRIWLSNAGYVDFVASRELGYDFADFGSAMYVVYTIIVGNTWSSNMFNAIGSTGNWDTCLLFVALHFVSVFLMLNIVQSVFVFAFSTMLSDDAFSQTVEKVLMGLDKKLKLGAKPKFLSRARTVNNLMLQQNEIETEFSRWLVEEANPHLQRMVAACTEAYQSKFAKSDLPTLTEEPKSHRGEMSPEEARLYLMTANPAPPTAAIMAKNPGANSNGTAQREFDRPANVSRGIIPRTNSIPQPNAGPTAGVVASQEPATRPATASPFNAPPRTVMPPPQKNLGVQPPPALNSFRASPVQPPGTGVQPPGNAVRPPFAQQQAQNNQQQPFGQQPPGYNNQQQPYNNQQPLPYNNQQPPYNQQPPPYNQYNNQPPPYNAQQQQQNNQYNNQQPPPYNNQPPPYNNQQPPPYNNQQPPPYNQYNNQQPPPYNQYNNQYNNQQYPPNNQYNSNQPQYNQRGSYTSQGSAQPRAILMDVDEIDDMGYGGTQFRSPFGMPQNENPQAQQRDSRGGRPRNVPQRPMTLGEVRAAPLFNNPQVLDQYTELPLTGRPWVDWHRKGFRLVSDIFTEDGHVDWDRLEASFEDHKKMRKQLKYLCRCLPRQWRVVLRDSQTSFQ